MDIVDSNGATALDWFFSKPKEPDEEKGCFPESPEKRYEVLYAILAAGANERITGTAEAKGVIIVLYLELLLVVLFGPCQSLWAHICYW